MIRLLNHTANSIDTALLVSSDDATEILDICTKYYGELSGSRILEMIQNEYGYRGMVLAAFIIGKLDSNYKSNFNLKHVLSWQKQN